MTAGLSGAHGILLKIQTLPKGICPFLPTEDSEKPKIF
jgi:hypothetical protein